MDIIIIDRPALVELTAVNDLKKNFEVQMNLNLGSSLSVSRIAV